MSESAKKTGEGNSTIYYCLSCDYLYFWLVHVAEGKKKATDYASAAKQSLQDTGSKATEKGQGKIEYSKIKLEEKVFNIP